MNKKAFTLIELVLVIFIISIIGIAAFSATNSSSRKAFEFIANVEDLSNLIREARSKSVNQKSLNIESCDDQIPHLSDSYTIRLIPDKRGEGGKIEVYQNGCEIEYKATEIDKKYKIEIYGKDTHSTLKSPIDLSYNTESGNFSLYANTIKINKRDNKIVSIKFTDSKENNSKYISIFQISGLPEVLDANLFEQANWNKNK